MIPFVKMNGAGNEIVVADMRGREDYFAPSAAKALFEEHGLAFDQLMEIRSPRAEGIDAGILIYNSDGSEAEACGNGMRCVVSYLNGETNQVDFSFRTRPGKLSAHFEDGENIAISMGSPRFEWNQIPLSEEFADTTGIEMQVGPIDDPVLHSPSAANMGNPHIVFWVDDDVWGYDLDRFGPLLEFHPLLPEGANITIARRIDPRHFEIRTWERGAGLTLACGSAACATVVCAARKGIGERTAQVIPPSGKVLKIEWMEDNRVLMSGPAEFEFAGRIDPLTGRFERDD